VSFFDRQTDKPTDGLTANLPARVGAGSVSGHCPAAGPGRALVSRIWPAPGGGRDREREYTERRRVPYIGYVGTGWTEQGRAPPPTNNRIQWPPPLVGSILNEEGIPDLMPAPLMVLLQMKRDHGSNGHPPALLVFKMKGGSWV